MPAHLPRDCFNNVGTEVVKPNKGLEEDWFGVDVFYTKRGRPLSNKRGEGGGNYT